MLKKEWNQKKCEYTEKEKGSKKYKRLIEKATGYWMSSKKLKRNEHVQQKNFQMLKNFETIEAIRPCLTNTDHSLWYKSYRYFVTIHC